MADTIEVDVCVVGAGPVGGVLACLLAASGQQVAIVDRAALPPMTHPDFDVGRAAVSAWADTRHPGLRRPGRAAGVLAVPALRRRRAG